MSSRCVVCRFVGLPAFLGGLLASQVVGCAPEPLPISVDSLPVFVPPVRAVEVVGDENFVQMPPDPPSADVLVAFDFDDSDAALERWTLGDKADDKAAQGQLRATPDGYDGTPGIHVGPEKRTGSGTCVPVTTNVPVRMGARYQISARVKAVGLSGGSLKAGAGIEVAALKGTPEENEVLTRNITPTRLRGDSEGWQTMTVAIDAPRNTDALQIDLHRCSGSGRGFAIFDDVTVAMVSQQASALDAPDISRWQRAEPHPLVRWLSPDGDNRPGIITLAPAEWVLRVDRSVESTLQVGLAADFRTHPATRVCFDIREDGGEQLLHQCLSRDQDHFTKDGEGWIDATIPLPARDGPTTLRFRTERNGGPEDSAAIGLWGNPRIIPVERTAPKETRPDIVLVIFDTLRRDHLGFSGYDIHPTSRDLDAFAATAFDYADNSSPAGWTLTSGSSIITGRFPAFHGAGWRVRREQAQLRLDKVDKDVARTLDFTAISPDVPTIAERMHSLGYRTVMVASNHFLSPDFGFGRGFDRHAQYGGSSSQGAERLKMVVDNILQREPLGEGEPLFMVVHFIDAHIPYRFRMPGRANWAPPTDIAYETDWFYGRRVFRIDKLNDTLREYPDSLLSFYDADIAHADGVFGQVLELVEPSGAGIIVTADHGEEFDDHGWYEHGHNVWQELVNVPLLVRPPGYTGGGTKVEQPTSVVDVVPTLLSWVGEHDESLDGVVLSGQTDPRLDERLVWLEHQYMGPDRTGYRLGDLKVVFTHPVGWIDNRMPSSRNALDNSAKKKSDKDKAYNYPIDAGGRVYDLSQDPEEQAERLLAPGDPLLRPIEARIAEHMPGTHLRCTRADARLEVRFEADVSLVRVAPVSLSEADKVTIPGDHRTVQARFVDGALGAGTGPLVDEPWIVIDAQGGADVRVVGELPPSCKVWTVKGRGFFVDLDGDTQKMLEELGYMGH